MVRDRDSLEQGEPKQQRSGIPSKTALGKIGEDAAVEWLQARGMLILERNFRCRIGEIDIIGEMDGVLVFVEVRGRSDERWGTGAESVSYKKKNKLKQVAYAYLMKNGQSDRICRFDVLSLLYSTSREVERIDWFPNAF